jgi:hypothetical protein
MQSAETVLGVLRLSRTRRKSLESYVRRKAPAWFGGGPHGKGSPVKEDTSPCGLSCVKRTSWAGWFCRDDRDMPRQMRQAAVRDAPWPCGHRCPRGREGGRPGPGLACAERGNPVMVRHLVPVGRS